MTFTVCHKLYAGSKRLGDGKTVAEELGKRQSTYEGWNFNSDKYLFTTDTK